MAGAAAIISVHCQLPRDIEWNDFSLNPTGWEWHQVLEFPISKLKGVHVLKPYKWIRYATGIVVGTHGDLRTVPEPDSVAMDYDSDLSRVSTNLYYHTTDEEKSQMFPINPNLANTRIMTSSRMCTRRDDFRRDVERRDGGCVVTGDPSMVCSATHLLPHSKGDTYIERFTTSRCRSSNGDDTIIRDIDDIRNGLFLNMGIRSRFGTSAAIMKTPNFAMDTTDIDADADPAQERFTYHLIDRSIRVLYPEFSGSTIHVSSDMSIWPPAALFDAVYASMVWYHFGRTNEFVKKWEDVFFPAGPMTAAQADVKRRERDKRVKGCTMRGDAMDSLDMVMMCPYMAMGPAKTREYLKKCEEVAAAREHKVLEEKVDSWRQGVI